MTTVIVPPARGVTHIVYEASSLVLRPMGSRVTVMTLDSGSASAAALAAQAAAERAADAAEAATSAISPIPDNQIVDNSGLYVPGTLDLGTFT